MWGDAMTKSGKHTKKSGKHTKPKTNRKRSSHTCPLCSQNLKQKLS